MASRTDLHTLLVNTLGSSNVYFQSPPNFIMQYPCIEYELSDIDTKFANDNVYAHVKREYKVTFITTDPDSSIVDAISDLPSCTFDRAFPKDQLRHFVFTILF